MPAKRRPRAVEIAADAASQPPRSGRFRTCRIFEPTDPTIEPTRQAIEPTRQAIEPTRPIFDATCRIFEPTRPIVDPLCRIFDSICRIFEPTFPIPDATCRIFGPTRQRVRMAVTVRASTRQAIETSCQMARAVFPSQWKTDPFLDPVELLTDASVTGHRSALHALSITSRIFDPICRVLDPICPIVDPTCPILEIAVAARSNIAPDGLVGPMSHIRATRRALPGSASSRRRGVACYSRHV